MDEPSKYRSLTTDSSSLTMALSDGLKAYASSLLFIIVGRKDDGFLVITLNDELMNGGVTSSTMKSISDPTRSDSLTVLLLVVGDMMSSSLSLISKSKSSKVERVSSKLLIVVFIMVGYR